MVFNLILALALAAGALVVSYLVRRSRPRAAAPDQVLDAQREDVRSALGSRKKES